MDYGEKLSRARKRKGMTQQSLAEAVGVSKEAVSKWEKGVYRPDEAHREMLCELLDLAYFDENGEMADGRLFDEVHMSAFLKGKLSAGDFSQAQKALDFAKEQHRGQFRKGPGSVPYISHPLMMACHAFAMGVANDTLLAAVFLHDVLEDCGGSAEDLPAGEDAKEIVRLLTKKGPGFSERQYYEDIAANPDACLVKCLDRCNNLSTMAMGFSKTGIADYIEETERYFPRLLRVVKGCASYNNAAWLLEYQMKSLLAAAKRILQSSGT